MSDNAYRVLHSEEFFALDGWQRVVDVSAHKYSPDTRTLSLNVSLSGPELHTGVILVQIPRHDVVRVRFNPDKRDATEYSPESTRSQAHEMATARAQHNPEGVTITEHLDRLEVRTAREGSPYLVVRIEYHPYSMEIWRVLDDGEMLPVFQDGDHPLRFRSNGDPNLGHSVMSIRTKPATARYTGFGEHGGQQNHSATFFLELNATPDRATACGVFLDNPAQVLLDVGTVDPNQVRLATRFGDFDQYLFVGDEPAAVLHRYSQIVDHTRLKPRWALGYHQGCDGYDTRAALESAAGTYRDPALGVPIDGLHIDFDNESDDQSSTAESDKFPEAKGIFAGLREQGYKCSTNSTPFIGDQDPNYRTSERGRRTGNNASTWDFLRISVPQMLARGMSGQPMTGADVGGFETGADNESWADPALLIRWTAAAAFSPWFRNRYTRKGSKEFQEPWAYERLSEDRYPAEQRWLYKSVLPICRHYIGLRYRMMQVFYDAMFSNLDTGQPICRPLFLAHPRDSSLLETNSGFQDSEFMLGNDILVAPVLDPEDPQDPNRGFRDVYLPAGTDWFSFKDGRQPLEQRQPGGTTVRFDAHLSDDPEHQPFTVPVYIRAGAVIPMLELEQYVGQRHEQGLPHPITFTIYPGSDGSCTSYLDDGVSRSSAPEADPALDEDPAGRGEYRQVTVTHQLDSSGRHRTISIERDHDGWTPPEPFFYLALAHDPHEAHGSHWPISTVSVDSNDLFCVSHGTLAERSQALKDSTENAWYYDESVNTTMVKVFDTGSMHLIANYAN